MASKFGFSWSWKRAIGISGFRQSIAKQTGIPTTSGGLERKVGRSVINLILRLLGLK
jgi:hypothetical protein